MSYRLQNEVRRILALGHRTKLDRLEEAAKALGMRLTVGLVGCSIGVQ